MQPVLLADVGATQVRFALHLPDGDAPYDETTVRTYVAAQFDSLLDATAHYLSELHARPRLHHAVFAVAGRLQGDAVQLTHNPWTIDFPRTRRALGLASHRAMNDFAAMSLGLPLLGPHDSVALGPAPIDAFTGAAAQTFAVLGPDAGFGVGALLLREGRMFALQTEGGHIGISPGNALEIEVMKVLQRRFGRVTVERLLCAQGLQTLQAALAEIDGRGPATDDASGGALRHRRALEVFGELLGATAGDFVLGYGAWQGVWLSGALVPHLLPWLQRPGFRARFEDKGNMSDAMRRVPVRAVVHPHPGLLGAAAQAMLDAGRSPLQRVVPTIVAEELT